MWEQAQASVLKTLLTTTQHFFGNFIHLFAGVRDPRRPELITYPLPAVLFAGLLTPALACGASVFVCRLGARRQIGLMFRDNAPSAGKREHRTACVRSPLSGGKLPARRPAARARKVRTYFLTRPN
jgi:hypothetical protein